MGCIIGSKTEIFFATALEKERDTSMDRLVRASLLVCRRTAFFNVQTWARQMSLVILWASVPSQLLNPHVFIKKKKSIHLQAFHASGVYNGLQINIYPVVHSLMTIKTKCAISIQRNIIQSLKGMGYRHILQHGWKHVKRKKPDVNPLSDTVHMMFRCSSVNTSGACCRSEDSLFLTVLERSGYSTS